MAGNIKTERCWGGMERDPEHRKVMATGEHNVPSGGDLADGYVRSEMTGVKGRFMEDGIRRQPTSSEYSYFGEDDFE